MSDVTKAHEALEAGKTTGCTVLEILALFRSIALFVRLDCQYWAQKICSPCLVKILRRTLAALQKADALGSLPSFAAVIGKGGSADKAVAC